MASLGFYLPTVMFISLIGGFLPLLRELSQRALALLLSFSAGVLLGAVFFHMLPESGKILTENIGWPILVGFLLIFVMERFVFVHACEERECDIHHMGIPAFLGISLRGSHVAAARAGGVARRADSQNARQYFHFFHFAVRRMGPTQSRAAKFTFFIDDARRRVARVFVFSRAVGREYRRRHRYLRWDIPGDRHRRYPAAGASH
jgi:hypothetical protein